MQGSTNERAPYREVRFASYPARVHISVDLDQLSQNDAAGQTLIDHAIAALPRVTNPPRSLR
jgi:hypothetical protein